MSATGALPSGSRRPVFTAAAGGAKRPVEIHELSGRRAFSFRNAGGLGVDLLPRAVEMARALASGCS